MASESNEGSIAAQQTHVAPRIEHEVIRRYGDGAQEAEAGLCCPIDYDPSFLEILPQEIIEKDYGCGDPSKHINEGDVVLDLGSGGGKICYILSQKVGASGAVIGVDFNDKMLALAHKYKDEMAEKIGHANVTFHKGKIQDLALDLGRLEQWLSTHPVGNVEDAMNLEHECDRLRKDEPMIPTESVDAVVSNCVLNLVKPDDKKALFSEIQRVLKKGGRAVISDIVCDQDPTPAILADPELWSGCIAGAFREDEFLKMFEEAGFYGIEILERQPTPWQVIDGVEFRSLTVRAYKGKEGTCWERKQAVVYKGPWKCVCDDDGHTYYRGERMAVCDKTFHLLTSLQGPYANQLEGISPLVEIPLEEAKLYDCSHPNRLRLPSETKGADYHETREGTGETCCGPDSCC